MADPIGYYLVLPLGLLVIQLLVLLVILKLKKWIITALATLKQTTKFRSAYKSYSTLKAEKAERDSAWLKSILEDN